MAAGDIAAADGYTVAPSTVAANLIAEKIALVQDDLASKTGVKGAAIPVSKGGTGGTTQAAARSGLGLPDLGTANLAEANKLPVYNASGQLTTATPTLNGHAASKQYADGKLSLGGGSVTGDLKLPNSTAATSGYTIAYIDGDGTVSRGASTERVKKFISRIDPAILGDLFPDLFRFQMRTGDGTWKFGYIAERLAESDALRPFVVWETEADGRTLARDDAGMPIPLSIDFIALLLAQVAQLNMRVRALEQKET